MPRSSTGSMSGLRTASACSSAYGVTAVTPGTVRASCATLSQSAGAGADAPFASLPCAASTRTWALNDSSRSRSSPSKPFMTERITISAATPTHTPITDAQVMKETKNLCDLART